MTEPSDNQLLERICDGDRSAFQILVERHAARGYRVAFRFMGRKADAEDIMQDVFFRLWDRPWMYHALDGAAFSTWLYRVISNASLNALKRKKFEVSDDDWLANIPDHATPEQQAQEKQRMIQIRHALEQLPPNQKQSLVLCFFEDFSNQEAADIMEISVVALQSLLMRAKRNLQEKFK